MRTIILALLAITLAGCQSATRLSIKPEEANYRFTVRHNQPQPQAFTSVELALAEAYSDLPGVLKLRQAETGTFLLKPLVEYRVSGFVAQQARYTLKIVVSAQSISLNFELGREETSGWNSYAPESEIPKIRETFRSIAERVARAVGGILEWDSHTQPNLM